MSAPPNNTIVSNISYSFLPENNHFFFPLLVFPQQIHGFEFSRPAGGDPRGDNRTEHGKTADEEDGKPVNGNGDGGKIKAGIQYLYFRAAPQAGKKTKKFFQ